MCRYTFVLYNIRVNKYYILFPERYKELCKTLYLQVNYYLGVPAEIKTLQIPGCETLCPLDQFSNLMKDVIPSSFDLVCDKFRSVMGLNILSSAFSKIMDTFEKIFS